MSSLPNSLPNVAENAGSPVRGISSSRVLPALFAMVLGVGLVYAAGFVDKAEVHNAAHDARHSAGFPCH